MQKRGLALEGGGVLGVAHVGVLRKFEAWGVFDQFTHFAGASAGAIVAGVLACRASASFVERTLSAVDFASFKDDDWGILRDTYRLVTKHGWYKGKALEAWYGGVLAKLTGNKNITLKQVHERYGTYLVLTVTEVFDNGLETVTMDHNTFPDLPLKHAVRMSAGIPIMFRSIFLKDGKGVEHEYVDGGVLYNYPIGLLDKVLKPEEVVGIKLVAGSATHAVHNQNKRCTTKLNRVPPKSLMHFFESLVMGLRSQALHVHVKSGDWARTICVGVGELKSTDFELSRKKQGFLLAQGEQAAEKYKHFVVA